MKTGMEIETADKAILNEQPAGDAGVLAEEQASGEGEEGRTAETQESLRKKTKPADLRMVRSVEAALFLANRTVSYEELAKITSTSKQTARTLVERLKEEYEAKESAIEVVVGDEGALLQAKVEFLQNASELSKKPDISRKATRILALVAKKGGMLQSELKKYFKGEIYDYTTELKQAGYLDSEKRGNTRYLRPSKKFSESFQIA